MVTGVESMCQPGVPSLERWQGLLRDRFHSVQDLLEHLQLSAHQVLDADLHHRSFPLFVPRCYANKMVVGDPRDPLLLEVLPRHQERVDKPGFVDDPLNERSHNPVPGLLHKYKGRVLLTLNAACAVHCRYCFRRHYTYPQDTLEDAFSAGWLDYIRDNPTVKEVIFSGGDPLMLPDSAWLSWMQSLSSIQHVDVLRVHSRMPSVVPERITQDWCQLMRQSRQKIVMVMHVNHANALDDAVDLACRRMKQAGIVLLNQSVLLRGVNDMLSAQINLQERLFISGVLPYYLHLLDPVAAAWHFEVSEDKALALHRGMKENLAGYLVPRLVRDIPGIAHKSWF
jgi:L-lysine 2,3-aminomutase